MPKAEKKGALQSISVAMAVTLHTVQLGLNRKIDEAACVCVPATASRKAWLLSVRLSPIAPKSDTEHTLAGEATYCAGAAAHVVTAAARTATTRYILTG